MPDPLHRVNSPSGMSSANTTTRKTDADPSLDFAGELNSNLQRFQDSAGDVHHSAANESGAVEAHKKSEAPPPASEGESTDRNYLDAIGQARQLQQRQATHRVGENRHTARGQKGLSEAPQKQKAAQASDTAEDDPQKQATTSSAPDPRLLTALGEPPDVIKGPSVARAFVEPPSDKVNALGVNVPPLLPPGQDGNNGDAALAEPSMRPLIQTSPENGLVADPSMPILAASMDEEAIQASAPKLAASTGRANGPNPSASDLPAVTDFRLSTTMMVQTPPLEKTEPALKSREPSKGSDDSRPSSVESVSLKEILGNAGENPTKATTALEQGIERPQPAPAQTATLERTDRAGLSAPMTPPSLSDTPSAAALLTSRPQAFVAPTETSTALARDTPVLQIDDLPGTPAFEANALRNLRWMVESGIERAEIALHPADLGPVQVRLEIQQGQADLSFLAPVASTRDALEAALPQLKEMFEQQGLTLGQTHVGDSGTNTPWPSQTPSRSAPLTETDEANTDDSSSGKQAQISPALNRQRLLDLYA